MKSHPPHDSQWYRLVDAAANRAGEGLRVVEDYVRLALDDGHLTAQWKQLRHDLNGCLASIDLGRRCAARQTQTDVGTSITTDAERSRDNLAAVAAAGAARVQQSLRSLEEYAKLFDAALASQLEALRYRSYTLAAAVQVTSDSLRRLEVIRLYVLLDGRPSTEALEQIAEALVVAGVGAIQLRDKGLTDRELLDRANRLRAITRDSQTLLIMNDRPDLAMLARADGVHVGQDELSVKHVRTILGTDALVGVSTHSIDQARQAVLDGANYIGVGPVFPSTTKDFDQFVGVDLLRQVAAEIRLPAFAIGGITAERLGDVLRSGIDRIAVGAAVTAAADPAAAAVALANRLAGAAGP